MVQLFVLLLTLSTWDGTAIHHVEGLTEARCRNLRTAWLADIEKTHRRLNGASAICMPVGNPSTEVRPLT